MFSIFVYQPEVQLAVLQFNQIANCRIHAWIAGHRKDADRFQGWGFQIQDGTSVMGARMPPQRHASEEMFIGVLEAV